MKKTILTFLFVTLILLARTVINAQTSSAAINSCQMSTKEILSVIKKVYDAEPYSQGVMLAGEIRLNKFPLSEEPLTLTKAIATDGGFYKTAAQPFYVIRKSAENQTESILEINFRDIQKGLVKDILLEKNDVIFVPRGCVDGKLRLPTKGKYEGHLISSKEVSSFL